MDWNKLTKPFNDADVFWRIDRSFGTWARVLCYLDARAVMNRLDDAVGPGNWQDEYSETVSGKNLCKLSIRVDGDWVSKSDGAGNTNIEGDKGGISDAFKRAAVKWGIGRHLYSLGDTTVNLSTDKPDCLKHYLVVASKRGEPTKYGVAPSVQMLQEHLYPRGRSIEMLRGVLRSERVDRNDIAITLEAASATLTSGRFTKLGTTGINPKELSDVQLTVLSEKLHSWHTGGVLKDMVSDYMKFVALEAEGLAKGGE
tara:strand:- start:21 stop:788 length:768 start_codon:yes stop_codon:yes gene_type:complete